MAGPVTKIATCCYCGTRAALVLRGEKRHELACSSCGAPLHDMKLLKAPQTAPAPVAAKPTARMRPSYPPRRKKKQRKRGLRWHLKQVAELFDDIEDLFD